MRLTLHVCLFDFDGCIVAAAAASSNLLAWVLQFSGFVRSLVDADEHRMAERLLKQIRVHSPQARRIRQKHFWSIDKSIEVRMPAS